MLAIFQNSHSKISYSVIGLFDWGAAWSRKKEEIYTLCMCHHFIVHLLCVCAFACLFVCLTHRGDAISHVGVSQILSSPTTVGNHVCASNYLASLIRAG